MTVKNNLSAEYALSLFNKNSSDMGKNLAKVASGMKINTAQDDAAGYAISERMRVQIRALEQDSQNVQNGFSLMKTAEGAVSSTMEIVKTLKERAINAANDHNTNEDRQTIQKEINQFIDQIDDNALVTFNGKYLLDGSQGRSVGWDGEVVVDSGEVNDAARAAIIKGLSSEWVARSLELIKDSFGLNFNDGNSSVNDITVHFDNEDSSTLALIRHYSINGTANKLELHINMKYYNSIDATSEDGAATGTSMYLDRTLAHEFTHAVMAANIKNFSDLPKWFKEGSAEAVHGADDARAVSMIELLNNPTTLQAVLNGTNDNKDYAYAAGYMILRYMAKASSGTAPAVMTSLMSALQTNGASGFDAAINTASGGTFTSKADLITKFMTIANTAPNTNTSINTIANFQPVLTFMKNNFGIDTPYFSNLTDPDTGSITGKDAGGSTAKNKESIVPESTQPSTWSLPSEASSVYDGLRVIWPDGYVTTSSGTTNGARLIEKKLHFQVGASANQRIHVGFYDMRAKALGLIDSEGNKLSVTTVEKANTAIAKLDMIVTRVLDQQTDIGAIEQRLEYTQENITTSLTNVQASESVIRDADMAKEMTAYTKANVLMQTAQAMLAQANQNSSAVLGLLR